MLGFEAVPELIRRSGLPVVFSMIGESNVAWIAQGVRSGAFHFVRTRHEGTAVSAATGYSRSTGVIGVCSVSRGPGFANSVNALKAAVFDHVPIIVIVGESPATKDHRSTQNIDQRGLASIVGAGFHHASRPDELEEAFWQALRAATWNGCPQVLSIADGVVDSEVDLIYGEPPALRVSNPPDPEAVVTAVNVLEGAKRPVILAGQGALLADCRADLETLADLVGAQLTATLNVNRFFSGHPSDLGVCGDSAPPIVVEELQKADVVLAVGASLNRYTTSGGRIFAGAKVIQCEIDIDQPFMASSPDLGLIGDARETVISLIEEWRRREVPKRSAVPAMSRDVVLASVLDIDIGHNSDRGLDLRRVYAAFDRKLPADRIVVTDSARHVGPIPTFVNARDGRSWLPSRGYGSIGLGLGAAIGAAAGAPGRPVVLFCGDGGFMMASHDLDAVGLNHLDLTIVIMNDEQYGSELKYLARHGLPDDVARQELPDIVSLARAFGGRGVVVRNEDDLVGLELPGSGLFIVDVRIDPEVNGRAIF